MLKILTWPDPKLQAAVEGARLPVVEFCAELRLALKDLLRLAISGSCCGLAAPQAGLAIRAIAFNAGLLRSAIHCQSKDRVMVNPEIVSISGKVLTEAEASKSHPGVSLEKARPHGVKARWSDPRSGEVRIADLAGDEARVFLHLMEQLDGRFLEPNSVAADQPGANALTESER